MFLHKKEIEIESHLRSFTHCWLIFHSTGDIYVARIENFVFTPTRFVMCMEKMTKCVNLITNMRFGIERGWFPIKHYGRYTLPEFNLALLRHSLNTRKQTQPEHTSQFIIEKGDELIFTNDEKNIAVIESILTKAL